MQSLLSSFEPLASAKHAGTRMAENNRANTSMPLRTKRSAAVVAAVDLVQRRQGNKQQLEELLSRPSRRAEVILCAASLLPIYSGCGTSAASSSSSPSSSASPSPPRRRSLLAAALLLPPLSAAASAASLLVSATAEASTAAAAAAAAAEVGSETFSSPKGFSLTPPRGWLLKSKPGADALFASPLNARATVGITTAPVRLDALSDFGSVTEVADRLLGAELAKDGCLSATLRLSSGGQVPGEWRGSFPSETSLGSSSSPPSSSPSSSSPPSPPLYYFEYELLTTRAHKVVVVAVGVSNRTLYIANGFAPCAKGDGAACPPLSLSPSSPPPLPQSPSPEGAGEVSGSGDPLPSSILAELRRSVSTFSIS